MKNIAVLILIFDLLLTANSYSILKVNDKNDDKIIRNITVPEIIVLARGDKIINITSIAGNFDGKNKIENKYEYTITVNQLEADNKTADDKIKESALLAAQAAALIKTPSTEQHTNNNNNKKTDLDNSVLTLVYLLKSNNRTNEEKKSINSYSYLMSLEPVQVESSRILKNITFISSFKTTTEHGALKTPYDSKGAKIYILVILSVYSTFVLLLLILRVKPTLKIANEDTDREKAERLLRGMQEHTVTRNILEQLRNESYRKKAWEIYNSDRKHKNERVHIIREENTLKNLHKKLENINRSKHDIEREPLKLAASSQTPAISTLAALSLPFVQTFKPYSFLNNSSSQAEKKHHYQIGFHKKSTNQPQQSENTASNKTNEQIKREKEQTTKKLRDWAKNFEIKFKSRFASNNGFQKTSSASPINKAKAPEEIWQQKTRNKSSNNFQSTSNTGILKKRMSEGTVTSCFTKANKNDGLKFDSNDKIELNYLNNYQYICFDTEESSPSLEQSDPLAFNKNINQSSPIANNSTDTKNMILVTSPNMTVSRFNFNDECKTSSDGSNNSNNDSVTLTPTNDCYFTIVGTAPNSFQSSPNVRDVFSRKFNNLNAPKRIELENSSRENSPQNTINKKSNSPIEFMCFSTSSGDDAMKNEIPLVGVSNSRKLDQTQLQNQQLQQQEKANHTNRFAVSPSNSPIFCPKSATQPDKAASIGESSKNSKGHLLKFTKITNNRSFDKSNKTVSFDNNAVYTRIKSNDSDSDTDSTLNEIEENEML